MGTFTDHQVHQWLEEIQVESWVSLHYESPALGGIGLAEIYGGGYVRQKVIFSSPSNRAIWSLQDARFTGLTPNRLTHFGVWNAKESGELLAYGQLPQNNGAVVLAGQGYVIYQGKLVLSIA
jgi:hypothetical protein